MKHTLTTRILLAIFTFAFLAFAARSEATETPHLVLKASNGQTFSCTPDAGGGFVFKNVPQGTYTLFLVGPKVYFAARAASKGANMSYEVQLPPAADPTMTINTTRSQIKHAMIGNPADSLTLVNTTHSNIRHTGIIVVSGMQNNLSPMNEAGKAVYGKTLESGIVVGAGSPSISGTINGYGIERPGVK